MILIKITIIVGIIYRLLRWGLHVYIKQLNMGDKVRISLEEYTKKETIFFCSVGIMQLLLILLVVASLITLVIRYL